MVKFINKIATSVLGLVFENSDVVTGSGYVYRSTYPKEHVITSQTFAIPQEIPLDRLTNLSRENRNLFRYVIYSS